jgi:protein-S-isoprenylcysteine O-methyltransferase Ste14
VNRSRWLLPPGIAVVAIVTMTLLHVFMPIGIVVRAPGSYAGLLVLATGVAMIIWSRRAFQAAGTPIKPFTESTILIRHGLYRWSRNPMYLGAVLIVAGVAILLGSLAPMVIVIAFFAILQEGFIRREERLLDDTFGEQYQAYRRSVRRWL